MGASKCSENKQEFVASSQRTDKCAFSDACSDNVPVEQNSCSSPPVVDDNPDFVSSCQSKQSSNEPLFRQVHGSIESKQYDGLLNSVIMVFTIILAIFIKLLLLLDGFLSKFLNEVSEKSSNFQSERARFNSDAGSSGLISSSKNKSPVSFVELSEGEDSNIFQVVAFEEPYETSTIDLLEESDVVVTEIVLKDDVVSSAKNDVFVPSFFFLSSEDDVKPINGQLNYEYSTSDDAAIVSAQVESAEAVTSDFVPAFATDETIKFSDGNTVSNVTIDSDSGFDSPFATYASTIPVNIGGYDFCCLVDTGAAVTAVSADAWDKYLSRVCPDLDNTSVEDITSVNGNRLSALGKTSIQFVIQSKVFPFVTYVIKDLSYDVILGRDFLQKYSSKIDFQKGVINFVSDENHLPFTDFVDTETEDDTLKCSVHADFSFVIPPQSEVVIPARLDDSSKTSNVTGFVTPRSSLTEKYSVFEAAELVRVSDDGTIPVRIINPSFQPVKIYRRTRLADFEEMDSSIATFELNSKHSEHLPMSSGNMSQSDYSDLPDLSDSTLSDGDKAKFRDLFSKYRDVFAFSDNQLGRTSLVQHTIDTGDALPIKQRPYRTTPENRREIDRQVGDMLERGIIQESESVVFTCRLG